VSLGAASSGKGEAALHLQHAAALHLTFNGGTFTGRSTSSGVMMNRVGNG
jgi:hypothetical protein